MKAIYFGIAAAAMSATSAQAAATIEFTTTAPGTPTTATSQVFTDAGTGVSATFIGRRYAGSVADMNAAGSNVAAAASNANTRVQLSSTGLGVGGTGDGEGNQVDSNGVNELLQVTFSSPAHYRIVSVTIGKVDNTDTFSLFGGNNGTYTRLGFTGAVWGGVSGGIPVTSTQIGGTTNGERVYRLDFDYGAGFDSFRFGTNDEEADGYSLQSLSIAGVPEPSTWALLILGFGLTGAALRRKTRAGASGKATLAFS